MSNTRIFTHDSRMKIDDDRMNVDDDRTTTLPLDKAAAKENFDRYKVGQGIEDDRIKQPQITINTDKDLLEIGINKMEKNRFFDQSRVLVAKDGCISNPGGPSC